MAFDYKKEYKEFYLPPRTPGIVTVPAMNFLAVRGQGDPNQGGGAYKQALETAGCTPDMSAADINAKLKETFPTITFTGLTGDGAGITWDSTGAVSKSPKGMVIKDGAYVGMD